MKFNANTILRFRKDLVDLLVNYDLDDKISLPISNIDLRRVLLSDNYGTKQFALPFDLVKKLNLEGFNFGGVDVSYLDFTGSCGVKINPQKVKDKDLYCTKLCDVFIEGGFDDVNINNTDFRGCRGNVIVSPMRVFERNISGSILSGVYFCGDFDKVMVSYADFTGSVGAIIDVDKVYNRNFTGTILNNTNLRGSFVGAILLNTNFTGSVGGVIEPIKVYNKNLSGTNLTDAKIIGSFEGVICTGAIHKDIVLNTNEFDIKSDSYNEFYSEIVKVFRKGKRL